MFWGDHFDVGVQGVGVADRAGLVCGLIDISNSNGRCKFFSGETVFSDKLPVNARDISTRVNRCGGVDDFKGV